MLGMALFWAADVFAVWAGLAVFGTRMNAATLLVGYATGMVFTRRTAPLAGAGTSALALPVCLWYSGAPLATAAAVRLPHLGPMAPAARRAGPPRLPCGTGMGERRIAQADRKAA